jgi:hypothetical protein
MSNGCPNCEALCAICQDNTYNWHEPLCSPCRLAVAHTKERIIELLTVDAESQTEYCKPLDAEHCHTCFETVRLIALIKGEK